MHFRSRTGHDRSAQAKESNIDVSSVALLFTIVDVALALGLVAGEFARFIRSQYGNHSVTNALL